MVEVDEEVEVQRRRRRMVVFTFAAIVMLAILGLVAWAVGETVKESDDPVTLGHVFREMFPIANGAALLLPSIFTTSMLALAADSGRRARVMFRLTCTFMSIVYLTLLAVYGHEIEGQFVAVSFAVFGVLFAVVVDAFMVPPRDRSARPSPFSRVRASRTFGRRVKRGNSGPWRLKYVIDAADGSRLAEGNVLCWSKEVTVAWFCYVEEMATQSGCARVTWRVHPDRREALEQVAAALRVKRILESIKVKKEVPAH